MTRTKNPSPPMSEPPQGWRLFISTALAAILLALLGWAFIFHPPLTEVRRTLINLFAAFLAGAVGFIWSGAALTLTKTTGKARLIIQATNGCALFLLVYFDPPFREGVAAAGPKIYLQRICGREVVRAAKPVMVEAVCAIEGEVLGHVHPESELCINVTRKDEQSDQTCSAVSGGLFSVAGVAIRQPGFSDSTDAEISAVLMEGDEVVAVATPAALPVVVPGPVVRVASVSLNGGFTVEGTAVNLLPDEQLAVRVELPEQIHSGAAYLYATNQGASWTAHDRGDASISRSKAYRLTLLVGPGSETLKSFRTLPDGFREITAPSVVKIR